MNRKKEFGKSRFMVITMFLKLIRTLCRACEFYVLLSSQRTQMDVKQYQKIMHIENEFKATLSLFIPTSFSIEQLAQINRRRHGNILIWQPISISGIIDYIKRYLI